MVYVAPPQGAAPYEPVAMPEGRRSEAAGAYPVCQNSPLPQQVEQAKGLFRAGMQAFNEARYPEAVARWREAYRADCTAHALLLNLARAYELGGDRRSAAIALRAYLEREPNTPQRAQLERRIQVLESR